MQIRNSKIKIKNCQGLTIPLRFQILIWEWYTMTYKLKNFRSRQGRGTARFDSVRFRRSHHASVFLNFNSNRVSYDRNRCRARIQSDFYLRDHLSDFFRRRHFFTIAEDSVAVHAVDPYHGPDHYLAGSYQNVHSSLA